MLGQTMMAPLESIVDAPFIFEKKRTETAAPAHGIDAFVREASRLKSVVVVFRPDGAPGAPGAPHKLARGGTHGWPNAKQAST